MIRTLLKLAAAGTDVSAHTMTLYALAYAQSSPSVPIVELGVRDGNSTTALVCGVLLRNGRLFSYDIDESRSLATKQRPDWTDAMRERWEFRCKDSVTAADGWSGRPAHFERPCVGMLFIDTFHDRDQTRRELSAWLPRLNPGAVIAGHDYLLESGGVKQAVDEFLAAHADRFELIVLPHDNGLFVLLPRCET